MPPPARQEIRCFITPLSSCSYLPRHEARNLIIDPALPLNAPLLGELLSLGFRRSGQHIYRPHCGDCQACIPLRIPCHGFQPNRSQRRNWQRNSDLSHRTVIGFNHDHFELYCRYLDSRHGGSSMAGASPEEYTAFLTATGVETHFHEFRLADKVIAVAATDHTPAGLSAVYTFFDPDAESRGLGTYAILWQIRHAQQLNLPWLYLGYWIEECRKMSYKSRFRPHQGYLNSQWQYLP